MALSRQIASNLAIPLATTLTGIYLGPNRIINGKFINGADDWDISASCSVVNEEMNLVSDGSFARVKQLGVFVVGRTYIVTFDLTGSAAGSMTVGTEVGSSDVSNAISAVDSYTFTFLATGEELIFTRNGVTDILFDNVIVREQIQS